jgi:hypothetical protein
MLQFKGGNQSLTPAQIYSTLANTAIDMDNPSTVGFDVGFDFGTGLGLVNASAAFNALAPLPPVPAPNAPVPAPNAPVPVPAPKVPVPVPATKPCGLFGSGIFCFSSFCGLFGRLLGLCRKLRS